MKRDHLMGYTGHLLALGLLDPPKPSGRTPPRPPQSYSEAMDRLLVDRIATKRLDVLRSGVEFRNGTEKAAEDKIRVETAEAAQKPAPAKKIAPKKAALAPGSALDRYRREAQEIWGEIYDQYTRNGSVSNMEKARDTLVACHCSDWGRPMGTGAGKMTMTQLLNGITSAAEMMDLRAGLREWHETLCGADEDDEDTL